MKIYLIVALIGLFLQACNQSESYRKSGENSLSELTEKIFDKFLDQEFEQILLLTGGEEIPESIAGTITPLMAFVRAEHPRNEFHIYVESWETSKYAEMLPGMANNRALEYQVRPEGIIVIKWASPDGSGEVSLFLAYKIKNELYSLVVTQYK